MNKIIDNVKATIDLKCDEIAALNEKREKAIKKLTQTQIQIDAATEYRNGLIDELNKLQAQQQDKKSNLRNSCCGPIASHFDPCGPGRY